MRGLSDPDWKKGPKYDKPTDSEHALDPQPAGIDIDGVGVDEAEQTDGTPFVSIQEGFVCMRDMCDEMKTNRHIYTVEDVSERVLEAVEYATDYDVVEYLAENVTVVDYDHVPIIAIEFSDDELGYVYPTRTITEEAHGACYGHEEPDPEPYGL